MVDKVPVDNDISFVDEYPFKKSQNVLLYWLIPPIVDLQGEYVIMILYSTVCDWVVVVFRWSQNNFEYLCLTRLMILDKCHLFVCITLLLCFCLSLPLSFSLSLSFSLTFQCSWHIPCLHLLLYLQHCWLRSPNSWKIWTCADLQDSY